MIGRTKELKSRVNVGWHHRIVYSSLFRNVYFLYDHHQYDQSCPGARVSLSFDYKFRKTGMTMNMLLRNYFNVLKENCHAN